MWWTQPLYRGFEPLLPANILEAVVRSYAVVEVGGFLERGPRRGRDFERVFYQICNRNGVNLTECAGEDSLCGQLSASGFRHEVDGAARDAQFITHWELKHLTIPLGKNELLIFNGKALDFIQAAARSFARTPLLRFLLSGGTVSPEARRFSALWGIMLVEPRRFPLPLIYEALARGMVKDCKLSNCGAVMTRVRWTCRSLQSVLSELTCWSNDSGIAGLCGPRAIQIASESLVLQEQLGAELLDRLDRRFPEWIDDLAELTWREVGGW